MHACVCVGVQSCQCLSFLFVDKVSCQAIVFTEEILNRTGRIVVPLAHETQTHLKPTDRQSCVFIQRFAINKCVHKVA